MAGNGKGRSHPAPPTTIGLDQALDDLYRCSTLPTIATPFPRLNTTLGGGIISGQSVVMPGATGSGKTSLLACIASFASQTTSVLIGTYELPIRLLIARLGAQALDVKWLDIVRGKIERAKLERALPRGIEYLFRPDEVMLERSIKTISDREGAAPLVLLDYLQIMTALKSHEDPRIATASTSAWVRDLADETHAPVLIAAAVSRESSKVLRQARRATSPSDLAGIARDVSNVEYDAAAVLALAVSPDCDEHDGHQNAMLAVSKNRFGPPDMIGLRFEGASGRWMESSAALEPTDDEREEMDAEIMRSVRLSKAHLSKRSIVTRGDKTYVSGRKATINARIDELVEVGALAMVTREGPRGQIREYSLPPTQGRLPIAGVVPGVVPNRGG